MRKLLLLAAAFAVPAMAHAQTTASVKYEYVGFYTCGQGLTAVDLQIVQGGLSVFTFGPTPSNPYVPFGRFYVQGDVNYHTGNLQVLPTSWIAQPPGFTMIGLSGVSRDGGNTFEGVVVGGVGCTTFSIHLVT
jgi:hypothetical protein